MTNKNRMAARNLGYIKFAEKEDSSKGNVAPKLGPDEDFKLPFDVPMEEEVAALDTPKYTWWTFGSALAGWGAGIGGAGMFTTNPTIIRLGGLLGLILGLYFYGAVVNNLKVKRPMFPTVGQQIKEHALGIGGAALGLLICGLSLHYAGPHRAK